LRIKSILVPLDFLPPSRKTLDYAMTFARQFKAKLTCCTSSSRSPRRISPRHSRGRLVVKLEAFLRPAGFLAKKRHFRADWLPANETVTIRRARGRP
jgi:hypothetical protein